MSYVIKRIDYENGLQGYLTNEDRYGGVEDAMEFEDYDDAQIETIDPPWDDTGDYEYVIEEKRNPRFPRINWWCDRCGANLNVQINFDDHHYVWKCKKCGFKNSISADNIIWE